MKHSTRTALSVALLVGSWVVLLAGWPSTGSACFAGLLGLAAVFLAPL
jgi:hypothetical protein